MSKSAHRKSSPPIQLRGRISVEVGQRTGLSEAGADLLEQISISGSLSEAARQLHYSYRRAWLLMDAMNRSWEGPLVTTATGGKRGGGAKLTELGHSVLSAYRNLQVELEHFLGVQSAPFKRAVRTLFP
jgi:molybdate transport system regulatory protein